MKKVRATIGVVIDTLMTILIYGTIAAAIVFMAGQAKHYYEVGYGVFSQQGKDARGTGKVVAFTVEEGVSAAKLGQQLEEQGIVESARLFLIQEKVSDYAGMYVAGTYALSSEMTTEQIMRVICGVEASSYEMPAEAVPQTADEAQAAEQPAEAETVQEEAAQEEPAQETEGEEGGEEGEGTEE